MTYSTVPAEKVRDGLKAIENSTMEDRTMYAIEVDNVGKIFRKWDSVKKNGSDKEHAAPADTGEAISTPTVPDNESRWFSRFLPKRKTITALDGISFNVKRGEIFGLLGPNGSGKSTLIRVLSTLLYPDSGSVKIFGLDAMKEQYKVQTLINRVSVDAAFFKKLSAHENLLYAARLYGMKGSEVPEQSKRILKDIGFEVERYLDPLEEFSRGMQQKVAIARALLTSPVVLLLDEPTTGLDPKSKREVQAFTKNVREIHDATILLTTHDMDEADRLCDRIAIIDKGKIIAMDTSAGLKSIVLNELNGDAGDRKLSDITLEEVFLHLTGERLVKDK